MFSKRITESSPSFTSQFFFSLTRVPQIVCCSRHLLWDPISREISAHTSPSTSLPWSKENRKLVILLFPCIAPPLYINLNCTGPHISVLCPVFCFFCALIWKSEGWAWIMYKKFLKDLGTSLLFWSNFSIFTPTAVEPWIEHNTISSIKTDMKWHCRRKNSHLHLVGGVHPSSFAFARPRHARLPRFVLHL